ncbi:MAG: helix-turn-helix transcriptional regulator [Alphaproteobacteria bacterium]
MLDLKLFAHINITDNVPQYTMSFWPPEENILQDCLQRGLDRFYIPDLYTGRENSWTVIPWISLTNNAFYNHLKSQSGADGVSIFHRSGKNMDIFHFGTTTDCGKIYDLFLNSRNLIDELILHFYCEKDRLDAAGITPPTFRFHGDYVPDFHAFKQNEADRTHNPELPPRIPVKYRGDKYYLSHRNIQTISLIAQGKTAKEAALKLGLSPRSVEGHLENIRRKFDMVSKSELIKLWEENDLLQYIWDK